MRWLRDHVTTDGVVTTTDTWLVHRLCGAFVTDASTASRSLLLDVDSATGHAELLDAVRAGRRAAAGDRRAATRSSAPPACSAASVPVAGLVVDQQAALLAEACLEAGHRQVHVRHRRLPARPARRHAVRSVGRADRPRSPGGCATTRRTASTGRSTPPPRPCGGLIDLGLVARRRPARHGRQPARATACCACRRSPVSPRRGGTPGATASFTGMTLSSGRGHLVRALLEGIAAQVADPDRPGRRRPRPAADPAPRRRRPDPLAGPHAGPGRPRAAAGRGLPVAARHPARRGGLRPAGPRPDAPGGRGGRRLDSPSEVYEPALVAPTAPPTTSTAVASRRRGRAREPAG